MDSVSLVNGKTYPICQNYARMSVNNSKPFFFSETAAAYHVGKPGPTALQIKQAWWRQLYNSDTWRKYNHTRAIVWFEIRKQEWGDDRDFRLVLNQTTSGIMDAWLKDIPVDEMSWGGGTDRCDRVWFEQLRSVDKVAEGSVVKAGCALPTTSALAVETGTATLAVVTPSGSASATEGVAGLSTTRVGSAGKIQIPLFGLLLTILAAML